ncbi:MAG: hypothetical protein ACXAC7_20710 [Candidatus Hodarchaeales archaeon]|jgi:predicted HTH domain antitoxin
MSQISIRLKSTDYELIKLWAEQKGLTLSGAFKEITSQALNEWKLQFILTEYQSGMISLKKAWILSNLPLMAFLHCLEENHIEPPHTELMELKSEEKRHLLSPDILFKPDVKRQRESPEILLKDK